MANSKLLFIVLDGLGGKANSKTVLENPNLRELHWLAKNGVTGLVRTVPGIAPESDTAVFSILGYSLKKYSGRGVLEAIGMGVPFKDGDLALRCNFATTFGRSIIDRRAGRSLKDSEARLLEKSVNKYVKLHQADFLFKSSVGHRGVVVFKAKNLSSKITNTDPAYKVGKSGVPEAIHNYKPIVQSAKPLIKAAAFSADLVNNFTSQSHAVMEDDPINIKRMKKGLLPADIILSRDAGTFIPKVKSISKSFNTRWAILADMPMERGIAKVVDMDHVDVPLGEYTNKSYQLRVKKTLKALKKYNCLYIHLKGPDIFGHDGDKKGKGKALQQINDHYFKPLLKNLNLDKTIICVTGDHATPPSVKGHSSDPVPILIYGTKKIDKVSQFCERAAKKGSLGMLKGTDIMKILRREFV